MTYLYAPTDTLRITTEQADKAEAVVIERAQSADELDAFRQMLGFEEYVGHGGPSKQPDSFKAIVRRPVIRPGGAR